MPDNVVMLSKSMIAEKGVYELLVIFRLTELRNFCRERIQKMFGELRYDVVQVNGVNNVSKKRG